MLHIGKEVGTLGNQIKRTIDARIASIHPDMTGFQSRIIHTIATSDKDVFQKDIEEEFEIRRSSVTSVLQTMEKNGLIERISVKQDARLKKIILTPKAIDIKMQVENCINEFEDSLKADLSDEELRIFLQVINKVMSKLDD